MGLIKRLLEENSDIATRRYSIGSELVLNDHFSNLRTSYGLAREAVNRYTRRADIMRFYKELVEVVQNEMHCDNIETARRLTDDIVGYCTGYADDDHQRRWFGALPTIKHPIYGRDPKMGIKGEVVEYLIHVRSNDERTVRAVFENLRSELDTEPHALPTFDVYALEDMTGEYSVFGLMVRHKGIWEDADSSHIMLFLRGAIEGVKISLDKNVEMTLEAREKGTVS